MQYLKQLHYVIFVCVFLTNPLACTDQNATDSLIARQKEKVENNLLHPYYFEGSEPERLSIYDRMEYHNVPGVSIAVINNGQIEWSSGYGVIRNGGGMDITDSTLFQAASISKPVTAIAALSLSENGILDIDADVNEYLKKWKIPNNRNTRSEKVTVRRILNHTAGLTVHGFPGYSKNDAIPTVTEILDGNFPANTGPVFTDITPGEIWRYSGGGYTILQPVLHEVTGTPFDDYMDQNILYNLDMHQSTFEQPLPDKYYEKAAIGHYDDGSVLLGDWHIYPEMAAAGLWTTPSDLALLGIQIQESVKGKSNDILTPQLIEEMLTPGINNWGLGFSVGGSEEDPFFSHGGANEGYRAQFVMYVHSGRGVVIMTNSNNGGELINELLRAVADVYDWPDFKQRKLITE